MKFEDLAYYVIIMLVGVLLVMWSLHFYAVRDAKLFRNELIWYSRYQVVEEMYLDGIPEKEIVGRLLLQNFRLETDWTVEEIQKDLQIIKSY